MEWRIGDRFKVKPNGGWDEHLWNKEGVVLAVKSLGTVAHPRAEPDLRFETAIVHGVMDRPSQHPDHPTLVVFQFHEYLSRFNAAVEKVD